MRQSEWRRQWQLQESAGAECRILEYHFFLLTGFAGSTALVVFTWCRGLEGMWCFLVSGFPHQLFYLAAWGLLAYRYGYGLSARRGRFWSAVISLTAGGILAEIRLNPLFLKLL